VFNSSLRRTRSSRHNIHILLRIRSSSTESLDKQLSSRGPSSARRLVEVDLAGIASGLVEDSHHTGLVVGRIEVGRSFAVGTEVDHLVGHCSILG
jgi:hypothetical protein